MWKLNDILNYDGEHLCKTDPMLRENIYLTAARRQDPYEVAVELNIRMHLLLYADDERSPVYLRILPVHRRCD